jgi:trk system potassium uptake protein TrkA
MRRQSFAVIGLGHFGASVARTLVELGQDVIGIDANGSKVQALAEALQSVVQLDATDDRALRAAGIRDVDVAVISIGENIEVSLLVVMLVKEMGIKKIIAKAVSPLHGRILERLGVERVIFPEREMGARLAHSLVVPNVIDYIELSRDFSIIDMPAPAAFVGQTLKELQLRNRHGLMLIAIKRKSPAGDREITNVAPAAEDPILAGDVLSLLGSNDRLAQLDQLFRTKG